jgi:hypothetical protein
MNMNTKVLFITPLAALLLGVSGTGLAAAPSGGDATTMPNESGAAQAEAQGGGSPGMGHMMRRGMQERGMQERGMQERGMQERGMMSGGMMGMMGGCPMMMTGPNGKVMMQMHGEMMRAMGDIMIKYADKLETPAPSK